MKTVLAAFSVHFKRDYGTIMVYVEKWQWWKLYNQGSASV